MLVDVKNSLSRALKIFTRDDGNFGDWKEELHPRAKNGQFTGKGNAGKNEGHFAGLGVGGSHRIVVKNLNVKALKHGQTINEYIHEKWGGDKSKALSWLKWYSQKGDVGFAEPRSNQNKPSPAEASGIVAAHHAQKSTPLTKGKNAKILAAQGVTGEHVINHKNPKSSIHGMTINDFIAKKHGGDESTALSYVNFYKKNGLIDIKAPGEGLKPGVNAESLSNVKAPVSVQPGQVKQNHLIQVLDPKSNFKGNHGISVSSVAYKMTGKTAQSKYVDDMIANEVAKGYIKLVDPASPGAPVHKPPVNAKAAAIWEKAKANAVKPNADIGKIAQEAVSKALNLGDPEADDYLLDHTIHVLDPEHGTVQVSGLDAFHGKSVKDYVDAGGSTDFLKMAASGSSPPIKLLKPGESAPSEGSKPELGHEGTGSQHAEFHKHAAKSQHEYNTLSHKHVQPNAQEQQSLSYYSGGSYSDLNRRLRKGEELTPEQKKHTDNLDAYISKSKLVQDVTLARGFNSGPLYKQLQSLKPGDTFTDKAFVSTTVKPHDKWGWAGTPHKIIVRAKAGSNGAFMDSHGLHDSEQEVVLPRNTPLKYVGRSKEGHFVFDHH